VDENMSWVVAEQLKQDGHDVVHVRDRRLVGAPDEAVFATAQAERRTVVTRDRGFLDRNAQAQSPHGVVFLPQGTAPNRPRSQADAIQRHAHELERGVQQGQGFVLDRAGLRQVDQQRHRIVGTQVRQVGDVRPEQPRGDNTSLGPIRQERPGGSGTTRDPNRER
jgi:predicted nuclease of predicted toxin-antitoxin system